MKTFSLKSLPHAAFVSFIVPALLVFLFRINLYPIYSSEWAALAYNRFFLDGTFLDFFSGKYNEVNANRYIPLDQYFWTRFGLGYQLYGKTFHAFWTLGFASLVGFISTAFFFISYNYCRSVITGLVAVFIFNFSLSTISTVWDNQYFATFYLPLLATCIAILSYQQYRITISLWRWPWLGVLVFSCIIAPWFREIGFIPAAVILGIEVLRMCPKKSVFFFVPSVLLGHAFFPKILPWILGVYKGPIGMLGSEGPMKANLSYFLLYVSDAVHVINNIPPLAWIIIILSMAYMVTKTLPYLTQRSFWSDWMEPHQRVDITNRKLYFTPKFKFLQDLNTGFCLTFSSVVFIVVFVTVAMLIYTEVFFGIEAYPEQYGFLQTKALIVFFILFALLYGPLIPLWFLAAHLTLMIHPGTAETYNAPVMPALSLACAILIMDTIKYMKKNYTPPIVKKWGIGAITVGLSIGVLDHLSTAFFKYLNISRMIDTHLQVSQYALKNLPKNSDIFFDFWPGKDVEFLTGTGGLKKVVSREDKWDAWGKGDMGSFRWPWAQIDYSSHMDVINHNKALGRSVYYLHLASGSNIYPGTYPRDALVTRKTFEFTVVDYSLDPLRYFLDPKRYVKRYTTGEWDNTYSWVGWGTSCCEWNVKIELMELTPDKVDAMDESWFVLSKNNVGFKKIPFRHTYEDEKLWHTIGYSHSQRDFRPQGFQFFTAKTGNDGFVAKTNDYLGVGAIAWRKPISLAKGDTLLVSFDLNVESGKPPIFLLARDLYGNDPVLSRRTSKGKHIYKFRATHSGAYYPVFWAGDPGAKKIAVQTFSFEKEVKN